MALEESVAHFMAAVLTFTRAITEEGVQSLQADRDQLVAFFSQHCKPDRAVKLAAPLQDLKDVAAADSVDAFVLTYTTLLQVNYIGLQCWLESAACMSQQTTLLVLSTRHVSIEICSGVWGSPNHRVLFASHMLHTIL